jgi:type I restriction enzyme S subunit
MSKLKKYKFSELYEMSSGISSKPEQAGHGFPFISFSTVFKNQFLPHTLPDLMDSSEQERKKYSIKQGDILLTRTSETLDELAMSSVATKDLTNVTYSGFLKRLRPKQTDISYHKFMAFYLRSKLFRKAMNNNAIMTLRASLNEQIFSYLDLLLPEYNEQKKIGDFLYLLNQKIELNNRIITELEATAKLLYEYWFVQFEFPDINGKPYKSSGGEMIYNDDLKREIPAGWQVKCLDDVLSVVRGASPRPIADFISASGLPWIKISDATKTNDRFIVKTKQFIKKEGEDNTRVLEGNELILSNSASPAIPRIVRIRAGIHDGWLLIRDYKFSLSKEFMYHYFVYERPRIINLGSGSIFKNLKTDYVKGLTIALPPEKILKVANIKLESLSERIHVSTKESHELSKLRDWLLPMLMNGQVTVKDK